MKKFKKLIPALCMLLVSAVMLGTTTFAWFSMNDKANVSGMQITAKTNDTYLLISDTKTEATEIQANPKTTVDFKMTAATKLYPSAPVMSETEINYFTGVDKPVKITNKETAETATNWYTAQAAAADKTDIKTDTAKQLTSANFSEYVLAKTVYLTIAKDVNAANKLTVTPTFTALDSKTISGVKVLVVVTYEDAEGQKTTKIVTIKNTDTTVNLYDTEDQHVIDSKVVTVSMFLYYDGTDSSVFTNNAANIGGAKVEFEFKVSTVKA